MTSRSPTTARGLARWLKQRRVAAGLTQAEAAAGLRTDRRNILRWESQAKPTDPGALELLRLLALYGVTVEPPPDGYRPADVASVIEAVVAELADLRTTILATLSGPGGGDQPQGGSSAAPTPEAGQR